MTKKPLPSIARSRLLFVNEIVPWLNCCATFASFTPLPISFEPVPSSDDAYTSENSARDALKPTVLALAMLLPVTLSSAEAALSPLSAVLNVI